MCKLYEFLYRIFPWRRFRAFLIEKHFFVCSRCRESGGIDPDLSRLLERPDWIKTEESLWPLVRARLSLREKEINVRSQNRLFPWLGRWQWAAASLMVLILTLGVLFHRRGHPLKAAPERLPSETVSTVKDTTRIIINYAEFMGRKARPYIYQTSRASFIWFSQSKNSGG